MDGTSSLSCETIRKHETKNDTHTIVLTMISNHNTHHETLWFCWRGVESLGHGAEFEVVQRGGGLEFITVSLKIREPQSRKGETDGFCWETVIHNCMEGWTIWRCSSCWTWGIFSMDKIQQLRIWSFSYLLNELIAFPRGNVIQLIFLEYFWGVGILKLRGYLIDKLM